MSPESFSTQPTGVQDCWNRIGISGDRTCPELKPHLHCRNCPTYQEAGLELLNRPLVETEMEELSRRLALPIEARDDRGSVVLPFRLASEWFTLPLRYLDEIMLQVPFHSLPKGKIAGLAGLVNVRGNLVPCYFLQALLDLPTLPIPPQGVWPKLIVAGGRRPIAFPVEETRAPIKFAEEKLSPLPTTVSGRAHLATGILSLEENKTASWLNWEKLHAQIEGKWS